jgi:hypothetical protein
MQRRNFIQAFLASVGIGAMTKPAKALPPPKKLILFVRPQDYHMWMIRTQSSLRLTPDGVVRQEGTLRYDAAQNKLWFQKGDMTLPRIAKIRTCPKLVPSEENAWRVEYVD